MKHAVAMESTLSHVNMFRAVPDSRYKRLIGSVRREVYCIQNVYATGVNSHYVIIGFLSDEGYMLFGTESYAIGRRVMAKYLYHLPVVLVPFMFTCPPYTS